MHQVKQMEMVRLEMLMPDKYDIKLTRVSIR